MEHIQEIFEQEGGTFILPLSSIEDRLKRVKAYIFDWDGVFNDGTKHHEYGSPFSEVDAMGTNMLRFSHYLRTGEVPATFVVTGEKNDSARVLAEREHFNGFYFKVKDKAKALEHICEFHGLVPSQICFVYDDILDLSLAVKAGLRMMVRHTGNPMFRELIKTDYMAEYITGSAGGQGAVREICELLMSLNHDFRKVVSHRSSFTDTYTDYLDTRQAQNTHYYTLKGLNIVTP